MQYNNEEASYQVSSTANYCTSLNKKANKIVIRFRISQKKAAIKTVSEGVSEEDWQVSLDRAENDTSTNLHPTIVHRYVQLLTDKELTPTVLQSIVSTTKDTWLNKSKTYFNFTKEKPTCSEQDIKKLLIIFKAHPHDLPVIKFWQSGLSKCYRSSVLSTYAAKHKTNRS